MEIVCYILIVFTASLLQATLGFGFPVIAMAIMPLLFGYTRSIALVQAVATVSTLYLTIKLRKSINWKVLLPLLIPSVIIGVIVTWFSMSIDSGILFILLGCMLIFISIYSLFYADKIHISPTRKNGIVMGLIAGLGNGLFSIGGPTTALYLLSCLKDKVEYLACIQAFFTICNIFNLSVRLIKGSLVIEDISYVVIGWIAMLLGTLAGQKLFSKIKGDLFKKLVYLFILLNGIWIILSHTVL